MLTFRITETDHCRRAESFLQNLLPAAPLAYLKKLEKSGHLAVNGATATAETLLRLTDTVTLKESGRLKELLAKKPPALDILYEDQWIVVFNKAPGLPVHRAAEVDDWNLVELAEKFLAECGRPMKLRPVNRLDRGTSGAIILAKSATAAGMFGRFVKEGGLGKIYLAIAEGKLPAEGAITVPLEGKEAETRYRLLFQGKEGALLALFPITGRTHQIRLHLRSIGHPIWGDKRYGGRPLPECTGHALHSFKSAISHPATGAELAIHAPLPAELVGLIRKLAGTYSEAVLQELPELLGG